MRRLNAAPNGEELASPQVVPVRMQRVASLRKAIADGTYRISAVAIADKIIAHMLANSPMVH